MKPFKLTLQLNKNAAPHLFVDKIKYLIRNDKSLSPQLRKLLLLMKKTRMPYIMLASKKEIIYDVDNHYHLDRGLEPNIIGWSKIDWTEEEIEDYNKDKKKYILASFELFKELGYEIVDKDDIELEELNNILKLIKR